MRDRLTILQGDWIEQLREMPEGHFHCCVTSPPYFGLRDYRNPPSDWPDVTYRPMVGMLEITAPAWNGCLGMEPSIDMFVGHIVAGFREVWRVLRDDGTLWLNFGDSYAGAASGSPQSGLKRLSDIYSPRKNARANHAYQDQPIYTRRNPQQGLKPKDLCGIPWRVALALQADGWYLRSDIVWHKPNSLPESVTDRPTKSHEYLFLLTKSEHYFYDAEAVKEASSPATHARLSQDIQNQVGSARANGGAKTNGNMKAVCAGSTRKLAAAGSGVKNNESFNAAMAIMPSNRNKRTVWTIPTQPFRGAHYATFPEALVRPCILAGTSEHGCCSKCGAPWKRIVGRGEPDMEHRRACGADVNGEYRGNNQKDYQRHQAQPASTVKERILAGMFERITTGWEPRCKCGAGAAVIPCRVIDPFGGSGTTGLVALTHNRHATLIEINSTDLILERLKPVIEQPNIL